MKFFGAAVFRLTSSSTRGKAVGRALVENQEPAGGFLILVSGRAEHLVDDLVEAFDIHEISPPNANRSELGEDVGIKF